MYSLFPPSPSIQFECISHDRHVHSITCLLQQSIKRCKDSFLSPGSHDFRKETKHAHGKDHILLTGNGCVLARHWILTALWCCQVEDPMCWGCKGIGSQKAPALEMKEESRREWVEVKCSQSLGFLPRIWVKRGVELLQWCGWRWWTQPRMYILASQEVKVRSSQLWLFIAVTLDT